MHVSVQHLCVKLLGQHLAVLCEGVQGSGDLHTLAVYLAALDGRDACLCACTSSCHGVTET